MTHLTTPTDNELNEIVERLQKNNKKYYLRWDYSTGKILEVDTTDTQLLNYAKKNNIDYYVVEPKKSKIIKKSYTDNFLKNR